MVSAGALRQIAPRGPIVSVSSKKGIPVPLVLRLQGADLGYVKRLSRMAVSTRHQDGRDHGTLTALKAAL